MSKSASKQGVVYLRALDLGDLYRCFRWHSDPELYQTLCSPFRTVSLEVERAWILQRTEFSQDELNFAICITDGDIHIGNAYLRDIDWVSRHAQIEIFIGGAQDRGKGYGSGAIAAITERAVSGLGLQRLWAHILEGNMPSIAMFQRHGFTQEGRLRKHAFKDGRFRDVLVMGWTAA